MATRIGMLLQVTTLFALAAVGCSPAGEAQSYVGYNVPEEWQPAFKAAAARLYEAGGLIAEVDPNGFPVTGHGLKGPMGAKTLTLDSAGVRRSNGLWVDQECLGFLELCFLHELAAHVFGGESGHPEHGSVTAKRTKAGSLLNAADLERACQLGGCDRFVPEM